MAPTSTSHSTFLPNIWLQRVLQALGPWWLRQVPGVGRAVFGFLAAGGIPSCLPKEGGILWKGQGTWPVVPHHCLPRLFPWRQAWESCC